MSDVAQSIREQVAQEVARLLPDLVGSAGQEDPYVTTKEAAEICGLSASFLHCARSADREDQPPYYRYGRKILYKRSEVIAWRDARMLRRGGAGS